MYGSVLLSSKICVTSTRKDHRLPQFADHSKSSSKMKFLLPIVIFLLTISIHAQEEEVSVSHIFTLYHANVTHAGDGD